MSALDTEQSVSTVSSCPDCSAFLNWNEAKPASEDEQAVIFRSLVATLKSQPALDVSLESKTVSIVVLISSPSQAINEAAMKMVGNLLQWCSSKVRLALTKADLIPHLVITLNPLSLSDAEAVDIHISLMKSIVISLWLTSPNTFAQLEIEDVTEQQAVHETVLKQVLAPSEKYISHVCVNRHSIIDGDQSRFFLELLARLLRIALYYQPMMDFILHLPVILTIPSCLTFFEANESICWFLYDIIYSQRYWNEQGGEVRQMWKTVHRIMRMEGIDDVMETKLQNDRYQFYGECIVDKSIEWNNLLGMNLPKRE
ncbi:hypothetical protein BLNAU_10695 [Blattamonas nauphoetae]|uniref:Uncharacterized protein n=1 Tax=Blattamonas nauphoetae TaxID=2049346 RepID=A0ABQ9XS00_9EUKA|nr:hypothetical protein BLNAU_10695 [Blattamonas nauphoetae]